MKISDYYSLNRTQPSLDFIDVDLTTDLAVFVDPHAIRNLGTVWGQQCVSLIRSFFNKVLSAIQNNNEKAGLALLERLREPNETHLGLSQGRSRGHAVGNELAENLWGALVSSKAAQSGLLQDLEDTALMVEGIGPDLVSDITTNIIRSKLIEYTHQYCSFLSIPLENNVDSGPLWNSQLESWENKYVKLPYPNGERLLFVPKSIVRRRLDYDISEYYTHYILENLRLREISANTELVFLLKDGTRHAYKKDVREKYGANKSLIISETEKEPRLLEEYRKYKASSISQPVTHDDLAYYAKGSPPDWDALLADVLVIKEGKASASLYENAVEKLLSALFYPSLSYPIAQLEIHGGRKRIDITFSNSAKDGFFLWLSMHYPSAFIFVECKNYSSDPANPELDQLIGRFSPSRGKFGILVCRKCSNKSLFEKRCRDTSNDQNGYIILLDDEDLKLMVEERKKSDFSEFNLIKARFQNLVL
jgi:hypothetical protein